MGPETFSLSLVLGAPTPTSPSIPKISPPRGNGDKEMSILSQRTKEKEMCLGGIFFSLASKAPTHAHTPLVVLGQGAGVAAKKALTLEHRHHEGWRHSLGCRSATRSRNSLDAKSRDRAGCADGAGSKDGKLRSFLS